MAKKKDCMKTGGIVKAHKHKAANNMHHHNANLKSLKTHDGYGDPENFKEMPSDGKGFKGDMD